MTTLPSQQALRDLLTSYYTQDYRQTHRCIHEQHHTTNTYNTSFQDKGEYDEVTFDLISQLLLRVSCLKAPPSGMQVAFNRYIFVNKLMEVKLKKVSVLVRSKSNLLSSNINCSSISP